jgi:hydrogenase nickel incorporation protein HypA/HybF
MHELSLCRAIHTIVRRAVPDRRVEAIILDVGALRQVVPPTLVHCWGVITDGTSLAGSRLEIRLIPAQVTCSLCGTTTVLAGELRLACGQCGAQAVRVIAGEEFLVRSVDVAPTVPAPAPVPTVATAAPPPTVPPAAAPPTVPVPRAAAAPPAI